MIKRETIDRHLTDLADKVRFLRSCRKYTLKEFKENTQVRFSAERAIQLAVQYILDIGSHILSAKVINSVDDYKGVIRKLGEVGVMPKDFAKSIVKMASFRNILVHNYISIDLKKIHKLIQFNLDDFETFAKYILEFLEREQNSEEPA